VCHGDRLRIGGFEVLVETRGPDAAPLPEPPAAAPERAAPTLAGSAESAAPGRRSRLDQWFDLDTVADPLGPGSPLPGLEETSAAPPERPPRDPAPAPDLTVAGTARRMPAPVAAPEPPRHADAAHAPPPAALPPATPVDVEVELPLDEMELLRQAVLRGAGLDPSTPLRITPAFMEHVGTLLRTMTEGTLELLRSRAMAKRSIRAEGTRIVARENNPLKFAPDAAAALTLLLTEHVRPGFLEPVDALRDAHDDLQLHQLAMIAGMRAAVFDLISRLGPETIEAAEGPERGLARRVPALRDAALWRRHRQSHAQLLKNLDDVFEAAFGREFLLAYEAQAAQVPDPAPAERARRPGGAAGP
jgi:type VI secretion system FHA domain protein